MFKRIIRKFFETPFLERILILTLISTVVFLFYLFSNGLQDELFPEEEILELTEIARTIFHERDVGILKDIENEKSDILSFYKIIENSQEDTITVKLFGQKQGIVILKISRSYCFISLTKLNDNIFFIILIYIISILISFTYSFIFSIILNIIIKIFEFFLKLIYKKKQKLSS